MTERRRSTPELVELCSIWSTFSTRAAAFVREQVMASVAKAYLMVLLCAVHASYK